MWAYEYRLIYHDEAHPNGIYKEGIVIGHHSSDMAQTLAEAYGRENIEIYHWKRLGAAPNGVIPREVLLTFAAEFSKQDKNA